MAAASDQNAGIVRLNISNNTSFCLERLSMFPQLRQLIACNRKMASLAELPIQVQERLHQLIIPYNNIHQLSGLGYFTALRVLDISMNEIVFGHAADLQWNGAITTLYYYQNTPYRQLNPYQLFNNVFCDYSTRPRTLARLNQKPDYSTQDQLHLGSFVFQLQQGGDGYVCLTAHRTASPVAVDYRQIVCVKVYNIIDNLVVQCVYDRNFTVAECRNLVFNMEHVVDSALAQKAVQHYQQAYSTQDGAQKYLIDHVTDQFQSNSRNTHYVVFKIKMGEQFGQMWYCYNKRLLPSTIQSENYLSVSSSLIVERGNAGRARQYIKINKYTGQDLVQQIYWMSRFSDLFDQVIQSQLQVCGDETDGGCGHVYGPAAYKYRDLRCFVADHGLQEGLDTYLWRHNFHSDVVRFAEDILKHYGGKLQVNFFLSVDQSNWAPDPDDGPLQHDIQNETNDAFVLRNSNHAVHFSRVTIPMLQSMDVQSRLFSVQLVGTMEDGSIAQCRLFTQPILQDQQKQIEDMLIAGRADVQLQQSGKRLQVRIIDQMTMQALDVEYLLKFYQVDLEYCVNYQQSTGCTSQDKGLIDIMDIYDRLPDRLSLNDEGNVVSATLQLQNRHNEFQIFVLQSLPIVVLANAG